MQRDNIDDEKKEIGSDVKIRADLFGCAPCGARR